MMKYRTLPALLLALACLLTVTSCAHMLEGFGETTSEVPADGTTTDTAAATEAEPAVYPVRILSQNMRYANDPDGNSVIERSDRFRRLLEEYTPDLIGTQEYTLTWDVWLGRVLEAGLAEGTLPEYGTLGCSREGRNKKSGEFNKILYRKDRFELLDSDTTWLSETPDKASSVSGSLCHRICTWALLKDKQTGETFLFANTHLDHGTDEVREAQMDILLAYLAERVGDYPLYLTGDFNSVEGSAAYQAVAAQYRDAHKTARVDASTVDTTYHAYGTVQDEEIDFIFHNDRVTPTRYEIISKDYDGFVADHYGVFAEFVPND